jgi:hypothetical protein
MITKTFLFVALLSIPSLAGAACESSLDRTPSGPAGALVRLSAEAAEFLKELDSTEAQANSKYLRQLSLEFVKALEVFAFSSWDPGASARFRYKLVALTHLLVKLQGSEKSSAPAIEVAGAIADIAGALAVDFPQYKNAEILAHASRVIGSPKSRKPLENVLGSAEQAWQSSDRLTHNVAEVLLRYFQKVRLSAD